MASRFVPNLLFERELQREVEFHAAMKRIAESMESFARSIAPVGSVEDGDEQPGQLRDSLRGEVVSEDGKTAARLSTDDPNWVYKEFGTEDTLAFATLRRTLDKDHL